MISLEQAIEAVQSHAPVVETEIVDLLDAQGRVLATDTFSDVDMPPFNKSAMDGYAIRYEERNMPLKIVGTIAAGMKPIEFGKGECVAIMTGAPVPACADYVIPVENCTKIAEDYIQIQSLTSSANIAERGQDLNIGHKVFSKGEYITPAHIAMLAAVGVTKPSVFRKISAIVFSTGDELVEPNEKPTGGKIRNTNAYQLLAQLNQLPVDAVYGGIINDNKNESEQKLSEAIEKYSMVVISGGVSAGEFDYIPSVIESLGAEIIFHKIHIKPGKPTLFAKKNNTVIFALPGNPVSTYIHCKILVATNVLSRMQCQRKPIILKLPLGTDLQIKNSARVSLIPVGITNQGEVYPIEYHGSAHILSMTKAVGVATMDIGKYRKEKGELIDVRLFSSEN